MNGSRAGLGGGITRLFRRLGPVGLKAVLRRALGIVPGVERRVRLARAGILGPRRSRLAGSDTPSGWMLDRDPAAEQEWRRLLGAEAHRQGERA